MPKLSPDARAVLERFRAERSPGPARRHRNYEATLDRLDEDPLPAAAPHGRTRRIVGVAAAAVLVVGVAVGLAWRSRVVARDVTPDAAPWVATDRDSGDAAGSGIVTPVPPEPPRPRRAAPATPEVPEVVPEPVEIPIEPEVPSDAAASTPEPGRTRKPSRVAPEPVPAPSMVPADEDPPAVTPESLALETALIDRARAAAARGDDTESLALLRDHARQFPRGAMAEDRRALQALAACRSGAPAAAEDAREFLQTHARSPYAKRVRSTCDEVLHSE